MKKSVSIISFCLIVLVFLSIKPIPTAACSCMMPPPADIALGEATAVFSGEVVSVNKNKLDYGLTIQFNVQEVWKGIDTTTISVFTANDSASCGIDFIVGKEYLVYAHSMDSNGQNILSTTLCDRTAELANVADDLALIGEGQIPEQNAQPAETQINQNYLYAGILTVILGSVGLFLWIRAKKN